MLTSALMKHLLLAALLLTAPLAHALTDRVVAIVNDQIITQSTVAARARLLERQMGLANPTPVQQEALAKRTLSNLIDEELQRQYAAKVGVTVTDAEVKETVSKMATSNPQFAALTKGLETAAGEQMAAEIRWSKIVGQLLRPSINVSNIEIDQLIGDMMKSRHVLEREIAQIFMSVDADEAATRKRMEGLLGQLRDGADFATLARTYSEESTSAAQGGNMGWFAGGELNPQLEEALAKMNPGDVSGLIRTPLGLHIVKLENVRTTKPTSTEPVTELNLAMVARPLAEGEDADKAIATFKSNVIKAYGKPAEVTSALADTAFTDTYSASSSLGWVQAENLQSALQQAVGNLKPGNWSTPLTFNGNVGALYLLDTRQTIPAQLTQYRERVREHLTANRLELETRRLQRELRQRAFVDIRW